MWRGEGLEEGTREEFWGLFEQNTDERGNAEEGTKDTQ